MSMLDFYKEEFYGNKSCDSQVGVTKTAAQHRPLKSGGGGETY